MSKNAYDVIVVGGGFAGATAGRELSKKGLKTLIVEGRNRLGGRTWYDHRMGMDLEMGGTYVHWFQPHVWAEITRYNIETVKRPDLTAAYWIANGKLTKGTLDEMFNRIKDGMELFLKDALKYFPKPYEPLNESALLKEIDHLSVEDRLNEIAPQVGKEVTDLLRGKFGAYFNTTDLSQVGLLTAYRWAALSENNWKILEDIFELYKIKTGTKSLVEAIHNDSSAELELSAPVQTIEKTSDGHKVTIRDGREFTASAVVVAIPTNTINSIEFKPALPSEIVQLSAEKQASQGHKLFARVRNLDEHVLLHAPTDFPVQSGHVDRIVGDEAVLFGYVSDSTAMDYTNPKEVEKLWRNWLPEVEVLETAIHNWNADEFSQGAWNVPKKNQLTKAGKVIREPQNGLFFAGSDVANGWSGFIDGAIESGLTSGKRVAEYLKQENLVRSK